MSSSPRQVSIGPLLIIGNCWQFFKTAPANIILGWLIFMLLLVAASSIGGFGYVIFLGPLSLGYVAYLRKLAQNRKAHLDKLMKYSWNFEQSVQASIAGVLASVPDMFKGGVLIGFFAVLLAMIPTGGLFESTESLIAFITVGGGVWLGLFVLVYGGLAMLDLSMKFAYFYLEEGKTEKGLEAVKMSMDLFRRHWFRIVSIHVVYYSIAWTVEILTCGLALLFFTPSAFYADLLVYDALENGIPPEAHNQSNNSSSDARLPGL